MPIIYKKHTRYRMIKREKEKLTRSFPSKLYHYIGRKEEHFFPFVCWLKCIILKIPYSIFDLFFNLRDKNIEKYYRRNQRSFESQIILYRKPALVVL